MQLALFICRQFTKAVLVLFAIAVVNFVLIRLAPGDPALVLAGQSGASDPVILEEVRRQYGLDKPILAQLSAYLTKLLSLDLGVSYLQQRDVADLLLERLPATVLLTGSAFVLALLIGIFLGAMAAARPGSWTDVGVMVAAMIFFAMPIYWVGLMMIIVFSVKLNWLPAFGMLSIGASSFGWASWLWDLFLHLAMPVTALALFYLALYTRVMRASMLQVQDQDFVRTAIAKGVGRWRVTWIHVFRNAMLPIVTLAGIQAGQVVGGAILTESVFAWPGVGRLMFEAVLQRDYNLILAGFLLTAALGLIFNLITDLVYTQIDPRIGMIR